MRVSKKEERSKKIIQLLQQNNGMTISNLADALEVSEMTVRRDIDTLIDIGIVTNVSGAIIYNTQNQASGGNGVLNYSLQEAAVANIRQKRRISRYAASLIEENDCVIIDNGSTTEFLAEYIDKSLKATIVTCNLNIMNKLLFHPNIKLILCGGYYHEDTSMLESPEGIALLERVRANKVFASAAGIHKELGVTCFNRYELDTKEVILRSGDERILVADSSKFSKVCPCYFSKLDAFSLIVTDDGLTEEWRELLEKEKIKVKIV